MNMDNAFERFAKFKGEVEPSLGGILSEADARLKLINRMLTEVLGWQFDEIQPEQHSPEGFADYLLSRGGTRRLVIEAKKTGVVLTTSVNPKMAAHKVSGPALRQAADIFRQAAGYCMDQGVEFAVITSGDRWIFFNPFPKNGTPYHDSKAILFPSLAAIEESFATFYELAAPGSVVNRLYRTVFGKVEGLSLQHIEPLVSVNRADDVRMLARSELALDLEPVFKQFFSDLTGDADPDMLTDCFVETRESRTADVALQKLIENVSANVQSMVVSTGKQLVQTIEAAVETRLGDNILIVGNKGAGKSTFINRFFKSVLDGVLRAQCFTVRLDFVGSKGNAADATAEVTAAAKAAIEAMIYGDAGPSYEELQGLYYSEYQRWRNGPHKFLYNRDKEQFKINFGVFLEDAMTSDPFKYIVHMLEDVVKNRKRLPVFVFDNIDHHSTGFQEAIFQWSQAIRGVIPYSLAILPITDRTVWRLSKDGPFQTHQSRLFYLPVPSTKLVLERRVSYLRDKAAEGSKSSQYFLTKGIRIDVENLSAFAATMEEVFIKEDFIARRIGWLSNHDIRRGLEIAKSVITSPYLSIDELVGMYMTRSVARPLSIRHRKFSQALLLGNYNQFRPDDHDYILNVFQISPDHPSSPLLTLSILRALIDRQSDDEQAGGYLTLEQIISYFDAMQVEDAAVRHALNAMLDRRLIEPYDSSENTIADGQRFAITHNGRIHVELALDDPYYMAQMAFATPIRTQAVVDRIRGIKAQGMAAAEWDEVRRAFIIYCHAQDRIFVHIPSDPIFDGQRSLRRDLNHWVPTGAERASGIRRSDSDATLADLSAGQSYDRVEARVTFFDVVKGFGFAATDIGDDVFVSVRLLNQGGFKIPQVGSVMICDVAPGKGGKPQAIAIHSIDEPIPDGPFVPGKILFFNERKGFGFVVADGIENNVYLSYQVLSGAGRNSVFEGTAVEIVVGPDVPGRGQAVQAIRFADAA